MQNTGLPAADTRRRIHIRCKDIQICILTDDRGRLTTKFERHSPHQSAARLISSAVASPRTDNFSAKRRKTCASAGVEHGHGPESKTTRAACTAESISVKQTKIATPKTFRSLIRAPSANHPRIGKPATADKQISPRASRDHHHHFTVTTHSSKRLASQSVYPPCPHSGGG